MNEFEDPMGMMPAIITLEALLPEGIESLPRRLQVALERDDYSEALAAANSLYSRKGAGDREAALAYAILLVGRQLCDEALGVLRKALTHHAQDVALQLAQAEALVVKGEFESARELLDGLRVVSMSLPRHWSFMGDMYLDMDAQEESIQCYEEAIDRGARTIDVAYRLGDLFLDRGQLKEAAKYHGMAARLGVENPLLWETAAETYFEAGEYEEAVYAYRRLLEERPYKDRAWLMLGLSYVDLGQYDEAAEAFAEAADLNPRSLVAHSQLGHILLEMGRGEEALQAFRNALELVEDDVDSLNGAVLAAYEMGDVAAAKAWAEKAVDLAPTNRESRYNLGVVFLTLRKGEKAAETFRGLAQEDPEEPQYLGALAVAEMIAGKEEKAFEDIEEAQRLDVEAPWLASFAEEVLKLKGAKAAMEFLDQTTMVDSTWKVVRPMLSYLCAGLVSEQERAGEYVRRFDEALREAPESVPVMWDFESWEAFAFRLEREYEVVFDTMLGILEGRQEPEEIEPFVE